MNGLFQNATSFNQNIGSWNVSNVNYMNNMFTNTQLSTANYDALLIGWSTISSNENPLQPNVTFDGGNSKYCNGATARASIISTYGWTITDAGLDCTSLDTETFDAISLKLYPNPVLNVLNIKVDDNLINQPYNVFDSLGRVILNGNLDDVYTSINVEQLSKGVYYLNVSDNSASKFVKE
jgi:surface protein